MNYWIIALLLTAAAPARAAIGPSLDEPELALSPDGASELSLSVGGFHPTAKFGYLGLAGNKSERFGNNGYAYALDYLRSVAKPVAIGGEWAYLSRGEYNVTNTCVTVDCVTRVRGDSMLILGLVRVRWPGFGWRPYAVGGAGFHKTHMDIFVVAPGVNESNVVRDDVTGFAWTGRAGVEYASPKGGFIGFEAGYWRLDSKTYSATANGVANGYKNVVSSGDGISYTLRLGIRFGSGS